MSEAIGILEALDKINLHFGVVSHYAKKNLSGTNGNPVVLGLAGDRCGDISESTVAQNNLSVRGGADPSERSDLGASAATTAKAAIESYSTGEAQVLDPPSFESCICGGQNLSPVAGNHSGLELQPPVFDPALYEEIE